MDSTSQLLAPPRLAGYGKTKRDRGIAFSLVLLAAAGLIVLFLFDPSQYSIYPICPFHKMTGLNCPGCGSTRAFHELLHGHILAALRCNALVMVALPVAVWLAMKRVIGHSQKWVSTPTRFSLIWLWIFLGVTLAFTVLRNLPQFDWLSP
jgi:hypothetical protein